MTSDPWPLVGNVCQMAKFRVFMINADIYLDHQLIWERERWNERVVKQNEDLDKGSFNTNRKKS